MGGVSVLRLDVGLTPYPGIETHSVVVTQKDVAQLVLWMST